jgi:predicted lipoprotein with Yx(FWY)xxD motif
MSETDNFFVIFVKFYIWSECISYALAKTTKRRYHMKALSIVLALALSSFAFAEKAEKAVKAPAKAAKTKHAATKTYTKDEATKACTDEKAADLNQCVTEKMGSAPAATETH